MITAVFRIAEIPSDLWPVIDDYVFTVVFTHSHPRCRRGCFPYDVCDHDYQMVCGAVLRERLNFKRARGRVFDKLRNYFPLLRTCETIGSTSYHRTTFALGPEYELVRTTSVDRHGRTQSVVATWTFGKSQPYNCRFFWFGFINDDEPVFGSILPITHEYSWYL